MRLRANRGPYQPAAYRCTAALCLCDSCGTHGRSKPPTIERSDYVAELREHWKTGRKD